MKTSTAKFTIDDFISQLQMVRKLGPMEKILRSIPGMDEAMKAAKMGDADMEAQMNRMQAIYRSMTLDERRNSDLLDGPRRGRIARGAGVDLSEFGQFIKQYEMTREMMRAVENLRYRT